MKSLLSFRLNFQWWVNRKDAEGRPVFHTWFLEISVSHTWIEEYFSRRIPGLQPYSFSKFVSVISLLFLDSIDCSFFMPFLYTRSSSWICSCWFEHCCGTRCVWFQRSRQHWRGGQEPAISERCAWPVTGFLKKLQKTDCHVFCLWVDRHHAQNWCCGWQVEW